MVSHILFTISSGTCSSPTVRQVINWTKKDLLIIRAFRITFSEWKLGQNTNIFIQEITFENVYTMQVRLSIISQKVVFGRCWFKMMFRGAEPYSTHWGRVTHTCVSKLTIIASDNGLSPGRRQAIIWTNDGLLWIRTLGTNLSEILSKIDTLKMWSAKWRQFCFGINVLKVDRPDLMKPFGKPRIKSIYLIITLTVPSTLSRHWLLILTGCLF